MVDLENNISDLDRELQAVLLSKSSSGKMHMKLKVSPITCNASTTVSPSAKLCNRSSGSNDDTHDPLQFEKGYIQVLQDEINQLRKEKSQAIAENRQQYDRIMEYEELINSQQSELLELGRRVSELEKENEGKKIGNSEMWRTAQEKLGNSSPLAAWRGGVGNLPKGVPPSSRSMTSQSSDTDIIGTLHLLLSDSLIFASRP